MEGNAYTGFAEVYDRFMDNVPYEEWCEYLTGLLRKYGCKEGILAELGCGTGSLTELLADKGYDMIGIDNSEDMLEIAFEKRAESGKNILYLLQDMREFELYGTVAGVVSICDSVNYITDYQDLVQVFKLVNNYLDPEGIFIFDFNTRHKYRDVIGNNTIAENREEASFIWDNYYHEDTDINEYQLAVFCEEEEDDFGPLYRKYEEVHFQKGYVLEDMKRAIEEAGMVFEAAFDAFSDHAPTDDSERIYVIAREKGKHW